MTRTYAGVFFGLLVLGLGALSFVVLRPFLVAIAWAIVLAVGFQGPWRFLERRLAPRRNLAAVLATLSIAIIVIVPAVTLVTVAAGQAARAVSEIRASLEAKNVRSFADLVDLPSISAPLARLEAATGITLADITQKGVELGTRISTFIAAAGGAILLSVVDTLVTLVVTLFLLFFFLKDGDAWSTAVAELMPVRDETRADVMGRLRRMLQTIFRGSLLCALIQGVTGAIGWAIAGLPSAVLAGALMAILSLLPVGGTAIVWGPGAVILWLRGHHGAAIFLAIWGVVVTSTLADNVLKPILIGRGGELNTLVVFLGVFGGIAAFGLLGIFIGPIALAAAAALLEVLRAKARESRPVTVSA